MQEQSILGNSYSACQPRFRAQAQSWHRAHIALGAHAKPALHAGSFAWGQFVGPIKTGSRASMQGQSNRQPHTAGILDQNPVPYAAYWVQP